MVTQFCTFPHKSTRKYTFLEFGLTINTRSGAYTQQCVNSGVSKSHKTTLTDCVCLAFPRVFFTNSTYVTQVFYGVFFNDPRGSHCVT